MKDRIARAVKTAAPIGVGIAMMGAAVALTRWRHVVSDPIGVVAAILGLSLVVFASYATFSLAGFEVRKDGTVPVPRPIAWTVTAVAAILLAVGIFLLALLVQEAR